MSVTLFWPEVYVNSNFMYVHTCVTITFINPKDPERISLAHFQSVSTSGVDCSFIFPFIRLLIHLFIHQTHTELLVLAE